MTVTARRFFFVSNWTMALLVLWCASLGVLPHRASAEVRIKDITNVGGSRNNKLTGFGLVTGLNGTGGKSPITRQFAQNMLQRFGVRSDPTLRLNIRNDARERTDNLSVVTVTADLPPFAKQGSRFDVVVSAFDDAKSLLGGQLMLTPLFGVDGQVYALAAGSVSTGGFSFSGQASNVQKNHPTSGRVPNGATVEEEILTQIGEGGLVQLLLRNPDYETARRIALGINQKFAAIASTYDAGTVEIRIPDEQRADLCGFMGLVGEIRVEPDVTARVVINERTGTVIIGEHVKLSRVLITHANLAVVTGEFAQVAQPAPFSEGTTQVVPRTQQDVIEETSPVSLIDEPTTVGDLAKALNALGVTPRDLSSIFQQLKESGSLHAELEFK